MLPQGAAQGWGSNSTTVSFYFKVNRWYKNIPGEFRWGCIQQKFLINHAEANLPLHGEELIDACHQHCISPHPDTFWRCSPDIFFSRSIKVKIYLFMSDTAGGISAVIFITVSVTFQLVRRHAVLLVCFGSSVNVLQLIITNIWLFWKHICFFLKVSVKIDNTGQVEILSPAPTVRSCHSYMLVSHIWDVNTRWWFYKHVVVSQ